jgi:CDGSH-type Zn-finger protein/uncharacterized Fe-S cluster protein YjdI
MDVTPTGVPTREQLIHTLYEAAELEHNLMCTYLYAAFSLKDGADEGLDATEADAVARWRRTILDVAIDEMSHLVAVWNITAAVGGTPRFGRANFPLAPGYLPAGVVVKLAPFSADVLQHFIHLERPEASDEPDGAGFEQVPFLREVAARRLTPMPIDYATVGQFYAALQANLRQMAAALGESQLFCGDPALQVGPAEVTLNGARLVKCSKSALEACATIVVEGEGAAAAAPNSHFARFVAIREEYRRLLGRNPAFEPAHPAAVNPVLRRPPGIEGRVWIEDATAARIVDAANASYQTMLRLLAHAYVLPSPRADKAGAVDLGIGLMKAMVLLAESAVRHPAGPSNPGCRAGMSFTALRDSAPLGAGGSARRFFRERCDELAAHVRGLAALDDRLARAAALLEGLAADARRLEDTADAREAAGSGTGDAAVTPVAPAAAAAAAPPAALAAVPAAAVAAAATAADDVMLAGAEVVEGTQLQISFNGRLCIHSRFCVTGAPSVFLANVQGPWIHPDAMPAEELMAIARECPSGAIRYRRKDGGPEEHAPPVNLVAIREAGPYGVRGELRLRGQPIGFRATLCRCGASRHKPFCDGSHHEAHFDASGEPPTGTDTAMLAVRDGPLEIAPQADGPLAVRGNLEIVSGTGRMVARLQATRLCRCGQSASKPFCDGSHVRAGFRAAP